MSTQKDIFSVVKKLTGQSHILTIPRVFVDMTGSTDTALLLSQIIYWSDKGKRKDGWFYKSYQEWQEETGISIKKLRRSVQFLEAKQVLKTKVKKANGNPTLHYKFDEDAFMTWFCLFGNNETTQTALTSNRDYNIDHREISAMNESQSHSLRQEVENHGLTYTEDMRDH